MILGRRDDGTLEVLRADDEIQIADQLIDDIPTNPEGDYYLDHKVLKVRAGDQALAYVITEHDDDKHCWRAVRTADTGAPREGLG